MSVAWVSGLLADLTKVQLPNVFNPYADRCAVYDLDQGPEIRLRNLEVVLDGVSRTGVDSIWFGRELGWRGGRRTGVPLTDEGHLPAARAAFGAGEIRRATHGHVMGERTATIIWDLISRLDRPPMLWNAFPLHAFQANDPFSNRAHTPQERVVTAWVIELLVAKLKPRHLVAIGNDAANALSHLGLRFEHVRHPSYGGQREFIAAMELMHGLRPIGGGLFDLPRLSADV